MDVKRGRFKSIKRVLLVERWVLVRLRHQTFFSLVELNAAIAALMTQLNARAFKGLPGCRRTVFETIDKPAMKPLPTTPYVCVHAREVMPNGRSRASILMTMWRYPDTTT